MITKRTSVALAGALALGVLVGSAGAIATGATPSAQAVNCTEFMTEMNSMMNGAGMMNGTGMMNGAGMMNGQNVTAPSVPAMPDWMQPHHVTVSPTPIQ